MTDDQKDEIDRRPAGFDELALEAPQNTIARFRSRASLIRGTRFVLERQLYASWIALNAFLKLLFKQLHVPIKAPDAKQARHYRNATQNSKDGRS